MTGKSNRCRKVSFRLDSRIASALEGQENIGRFLRAAIHYYLDSCEQGSGEEVTKAIKRLEHMLAEVLKKLDALEKGSAPPSSNSSGQVPSEKAFDTAALFASLAGQFYKN